MAPPPPPALPSNSVGPCPGLTNAPAPANALQCAPCSDPLDPIGGVFGDTRTGQLCGYLDDGTGNIAPRPLPMGYRGFDDPQADPDPAKTYLFQTVYIKYVRADLYSDTPVGWPSFGPYEFGDDVTLNPEPFTGNPPWGSQSNDGDADGVDDGGTPIPNRGNQGMYSAYRDFDRYDQQGVYDATAGAAGTSGQLPGSCGVNVGPGNCNPYIEDCGGFAHYNPFKPVGSGSTLAAEGPPGYTPYPLGTEAPSAADWPMVPFARDYPPYAGSDADPVAAIKRLLRFTTSIVSYDSTRGHLQNDGTGGEYKLEEDPRSVLVTTDGTPIQGALFDAYNYFINTVFADKTDPAINCRKYIIVFVTDGLEACQAAFYNPSNPSDPLNNPCGARAGHPGGPSGDLGQIDLTQVASVPPGPGGGRTIAHLADPSIPLAGIPVFVVGMGINTSDPRLSCIATNSGGTVFAANNRTSLKNAIESILALKKTASSFAAPAVPAFSAGSNSDAGQIGAVIPSHLMPDGSSAVWSIWSGSLKSFKLDNGTIPVVTAAASTATPTPTAGGPTATPVAATPTPTATPLGGTQFYPDETNPFAASAYDQTISPPPPQDRRPLWNAARVLGYTDPNTNLTDGQNPGAINPSAHDPNGAIKVWPGRKMVWGDNFGVNVPMTRRDFMPNSGTCTGAGSAGSCFDNLMNVMGTTLAGPPPTTNAARQQEAILTVDFLRGGMPGAPPARTPPIPATHNRDQVLNILPHGGGTIGPNSGDVQKFSYFYQDDPPAPGDPPQVQTDGQGGTTKGYNHILGDIFHSEPLLIGGPKYFQYLFANLTPPGSGTPQPYGNFAALYAKRRKVVFVGANDGFLHAFDAGVWDRDHTATPPDPAHPLANTYDLGTGREIFAYAPRGVMNRKFPSLFSFPPTPQYLVDGSVASADVFMDPSFTTAGGPNATQRVWRSVIVGGLRQGGNWVFALDVTQPDDIDTNPASATYGQIATADTDKSPKCLNGTGGSCKAGSVSNRKYPEILWEITDDPALASGSLGIPYIGETWSKPVIGRIKIINSGSYEDRYVAIFGGGYDPTFKPGDTVLTADVVGPPAKKATRGRSIYMVDVETGKIIFKGSQGVDDGGNPVLFAPMPAPPAVADYNDDGYLDTIYIGDVNGRMWRMDLTPGALTATNPPGNLNTGTGLLENYAPFLLYDSSTSSTTPIQPIFTDPGLIYVSGAARPIIGVAWGAGDRANLAQPNTTVKRFHYVIDNGNSSKTFHEENLTDISPPASGPFSPNAGCAANPACSGMRLDFAGINEKATSTVFSTNGYLAVVTFTPDASNPCTTEGNSYRYSFLFLNGQGRYGSGNTYADYRTTLGGGVASVTQSSTAQGDTIDTVLFSSGQISQPPTPGTRHTNKTNWKEQ